MSTDHRKYFPALRGRLGDWAYYSCLMTLADVAQRVSYASELNENRQLSELIQRELNQSWGDRIAEYLRMNADRFFSSLVVAVYQGDPKWAPFEVIRSKTADVDISMLDGTARDSVGFISLTGEERLFALDGQHRLAGIKKAVASDTKLAEEEVSIILVAHRGTSEGKRRTRKLFTTLNKYAKPVRKSEIIALDEADVMAITVRRLVEGSRLFGGDRVLIKRGTNLPSSDAQHFTSIENLYDVLFVAFAEIRNQLAPTQKGNLTRTRPADSELDEYFEFAVDYFQRLGKAFAEFGEFLTSRSDEKAHGVVAKYRTENGGHILFRPIGFKIVTEVIGKLVRNTGKTFGDAIQMASGIPVRLNREPYVRLLWRSESGTIDSKHDAVTRDILFYMLGGSVNEAKLLERYARALEKPIAESKLPNRLKSEVRRRSV